MHFEHLSCAVTDCPKCKRAREREIEREQVSESERARERESERARERESERAREQESERARERESERARERESERARGRQGDRATGRQGDRARARGRAERDRVEDVVQSQYEGELARTITRAPPPSPLYLHLRLRRIGSALFSAADAPFL